MQAFLSIQPILVILISLALAVYAARFLRPDDFTATCRKLRLWSRADQTKMSSL